MVFPVYPLERTILTCNTLFLQVHDFVIKNLWDPKGPFKGRLVLTAQVKNRVCVSGSFNFSNKVSASYWLLVLNVLLMKEARLRKGKDCLKTRKPQILMSECITASQA